MGRIFSTVLATLLAVAPTFASALGLGEIRVDSGFNQTLDARVALVGLRAGDLDGMRVRLADEQTFASFGLARTDELAKLRFEPVATGGTTGYIRVWSSERIREPYLAFVLEVAWSQGRSLREYTVLLEAR